MRRTARTLGRRRRLAALAAALGAASCLAVAAAGMALRSPGLVPGMLIARSLVLDGSGCRGGNVSPALSWSDPPPGTRGFAVLMYDPDAPAGVWWHWAVFDIPARVRSLPAGAGDPTRHLLPAGALQARNDFGTRGYGGPCPPPGPAHHYHLELYALRIARLGLDPSASAARVAATVRANALGAVSIVAPYGR